MTPGENRTLRRDVGPAARVAWAALGARREARPRGKGGKLTPCVQGALADEHMRIRARGRDSSRPHGRRSPKENEPKSVRAAPAAEATYERRAVTAEATDEVLMIRFQRGDRAAFACWFGGIRRPLYNFALRIVAHASRWPRTSCRTRSSGWSRARPSSSTRRASRRGSTRSRATSASTSCASERSASIPRSTRANRERKETVPTLGEQTADARASVEREATGAELKERIAKAVEALPDEQREVFLMREVANCRSRRSPRLTGVPENTVKSRMRYALEKLQQSLSEYEEYARALR